eukprot:GEMP01052226.1.p1 GENE.GEMP01052226.1~~GEMP01052226.1.p1  ORF type:complete len:148 (-),score=8.11 GEMP01052226.1:919-1362(-)
MARGRAHALRKISDRYAPTPAHTHTQSQSAGASAHSKAQLFIVIHTHAVAECWGGCVLKNKPQLSLRAHAHAQLTNGGRKHALRVIFYRFALMLAHTHTHLLSAGASAHLKAQYFIVIHTPTLSPNTGGVRVQKQKYYHYARTHTGS